VRDLIGGSARNGRDGASAGFESDPAPLLSELGGTDPASPVATVDSARFRLYHTIAGLLTRTAAERPLLVVLEDLHLGGGLRRLEEVFEPEPAATEFATSLTRR
jgi:hypothetical protein